MCSQFGRSGFRIEMSPHWLPRITRAPSRRAAGLAALLAILGLFALAPVLRFATHRVFGYVAWQRRAALPPELPLFGKLAASQVGYGPSADKQFSSPTRFSSFAVVRDAVDGAVVFRGGDPVRKVHSDSLGDVHEIWIGDFTGLSAPGRYRIVADNGLASYPFNIGAEVFDVPLSAVQRAFYYQRAFTAIEPRYAQGPWVHGSDAALAPPGIRRGWHDAGDFSIYSASMNSALFWMLSAAADFSPADDQTGIPESGNGVPDLLDESRWGLDWLLSMQDPGGGFHNTTCQSDYGPYGSNFPERMPPYRLGEVGTIATGRAAGTLAFASKLYRAYDAAFADRLLQAARAGYDFLRQRPSENSDGPTCPAMRQDGNPTIGRDVRMYAAAGLLLATGEQEFRNDFDGHFQPIDNDPSYQRSNIYAALLYLRAAAGDRARQSSIRKDLRRRGGEVRRDGDGHPFQWAGRLFWGSIAAGFQRTAAFSAPDCLADPAAAAADCEQALANVHYAFGRNVQMLAYVSGLPGVTRGRSHAFHHWLAALNATPYLFPGIVAGGPVASPEADDISVPQNRPVPIWGYWGDPAMPRSASTPIEARYTDNDSWCTNELDIEWQGVTLYNLYLAQWLARGAPARHPAMPYAPFAD
jgi:endoglucanase